jgi:DNA-binding response OmpR family regulator
MKVLIVEDDKTIRSFLTQGFKEEGYVAISAAEGDAGLAMALSGEFDFVILDVMLPKLGGIDLCRALRNKNLDTPVLMLTAKDSVENRIAGLDSGADDYVVKPFSFGELLARMRAVLRRKQGGGKPMLEVSGLKMDLVRHRVSYEERELDLTAREFALLQYFMRRAGHILSRTVIIESVWGYDFQGATNIIDVYVNFLRRKLRKLTDKDWIRTLRHRGYVFEAPAA